MLGQKKLNCMADKSIIKRGRGTPFSLIMGFYWPSKFHHLQSGYFINQWPSKVRDPQLTRCPGFIIVIPLVLVELVIAREGGGSTYPMVNRFLSFIPFPPTPSKRATP